MRRPACVLWHRSERDSLNFAGNSLANNVGNNSSTIQQGSTASLGYSEIKPEELVTSADSLHIPPRVAAEAGAGRDEANYCINTRMITSYIQYSISHTEPRRTSREDR